MRLPPEPTCRLSGLTQPRMVKDRKPRKSSNTPSPALGPTPWLSIGKLDRSFQAAFGGAFHRQLGCLTAGKAHADERFLATSVDSHLDAVYRADAAGIGDSQRDGVETGLLEDVRFGIGRRRCSVAEIPGRGGVRFAAERHGQRRHAVQTETRRSSLPAAVSRRLRRA